MQAAEQGLHPVFAKLFAGAGGAADADKLRSALDRTHSELISDEMMNRMEQMTGSGNNHVPLGYFLEVYEQFFGSPYSKEKGAAWGATKRAVSLAFLKEFCNTHKDENLNFKVSNLPLYCLR